MINTLILTTLFTILSLHGEDVKTPGDPDFYPPIKDIVGFSDSEIKDLVDSKNNFNLETECTKCNFSATWTHFRGHPWTPSSGELPLDNFEIYDFEVIVSISEVPDTLYEPPCYLNEQNDCLSILFLQCYRKYTIKLYIPLGVKVRISNDPYPIIGDDDWHYFNHTSELFCGEDEFINIFIEDFLLPPTRLTQQMQLKFKCSFCPNDPF